jgi:hypothetical protein
MATYSSVPTAAMSTGSARHALGNIRRGDTMAEG